MRVEVDQLVPIFPDETIDGATDSFHQALGTHLDTVGAVGSRGRD